MVYSIHRFHKVRLDLKFFFSFKKKTAFEGFSLICACPLRKIVFWLRFMFVLLETANGLCRFQLGNSLQLMMMHGGDLGNERVVDNKGFIGFYRNWISRLYMYSVMFRVFLLAFMCKEYLYLQ